MGSPFDSVVAFFYLVEMRAVFRMTDILTKKLTASFLRFLDDSISKHEDIFVHFKYPEVENVLVDSPDPEPEFCDLKFVKMKRVWGQSQEQRSNQATFHVAGALL